MQTSAERNLIVTSCPVSDPSSTNGATLAIANLRPAISENPDIDQQLFVSVCYLFFCTFKWR